MTDLPLMHRRSFIALSATAGGAMLLQFPLSLQGASAASSPNRFLTGFLEITADNHLILQLNRHEMGQGLSDGLRTLFAEELNTAPRYIRVRLVSAGPAQGNSQVRPLSTGGSQSMRSSWVPVRQAAAYCREVLLKAAALTLQAQGNPQPSLELRDGWILGPGKTLPFAAVAGKVGAAAKSVDVKKVKPRPPPWNYIGGWSEPAWQKEKLTGMAKYGFDRACELVASIERPARFGATLVGFDEKAALAVKGVTAVVPLQSVVAVVAGHTWAALQGRRALNARWSGGLDASSDDLAATLAGLLDQSELRKPVLEEGKLPSTTPALERLYRFPALAHTPIEPLSCTLMVSAKTCQILAATQRPEQAREMAARMTGLPLKAIQLNDELSGGSFGRRLAQDHIVEALELGIKLRKQVKVIWSREDQLSAGHFRPPAAVRLRGFAGPGGALAGLQHQVASPGDLGYHMPAPATADLSRARQLFQGLRQGGSTAADYGNGIRSSGTAGGSAVEGASSIPYRLPYRKVEHVPVELPYPVGYWRSVGNSFNSFALETFLDEWATRHRLDPLQLRLDLLPPDHRLRAVLERAAELASWPRRGPGHVLGLACFAGYDSAAAIVVRLQPAATDPSQIAEVICSVDCGTLINPDTVRAQVEGSILMGLSAALREQVMLDQGAVQSRNFDTYPILDFAHAPSTYIELMMSDAAPGGIGEPALPPVAPALANAWRLLTEEHVAQLPLLAASLSRTQE